MTSGNLTTGFELSVIIPTYNPDSHNLSETLNGLRNQTLELSKWELIIIDNNSTNGVLDQLDISWHPNSNIIKEPKQGLTYSRIAGIELAKGDIVVMVDDDNILSPDYLKNMVVHFNANPKIGSIGGKITGLFKDHTPEEWTKEFWNMLAIRDYGDEPVISEPKLSPQYPTCSPVGAGMGVRRELFAAYINEITKSASQITDRSGGSLSSGGDNEINIQVLKQGYSVAYFPDLSLQHIIPSSRVTRNYLARMNYESSISWIKLLFKYQISPWHAIKPYTVFLRKIKAWINYKPWRSNANYIKWRGACGTFEALASNNE